MKKKIAILMAMVMLFAVATAGTLAWLKDDTDPVVNTFTVGNIDISLEETWNTDSDDDGTAPDYWTAKMIPGSVYAKDPIVTVELNSEKSYVFIEVKEANNEITVNGVTVDPIVMYEDNLVNGEDFTKYSETTSAGITTTVYVKVVDATTTAAEEFQVLADTYVTDDNLNGSVKINPNLTKEHMDALENLAADKLPTLTFKAYAVQFENVANEAEAWNIANS